MTQFILAIKSDADTYAIVNKLFLVAKHFGQKYFH